MEGLARLLRGYQSGGMPGFVNCPGTDPLGGGIGGDTAAILLGLKLYNSFLIFTTVYNAYSWKPSSHQPGWLEQM